MKSAIGLVLWSGLWVLGGNSSSIAANPNLVDPIAPAHDIETPVLAQSQLSEPPLAPGTRAMTVIGRGQAITPADTARLEFSLVDRQPDSSPQPASQLPDPAAAGPLQPLVNRLIQAGLSAEDIEIQLKPADTPKLRVRVSNPTREGLLEVVTEIEAALQNSQRFFLQNIGAEYTVDQCESLERQARRAALRDAQARSQALAADLGVDRADLLRVTEFPTTGGPGPFSSCGSKTGLPSSPLLGLSNTTFHPYNPSLEPQVQILSQVSLTYEIQPLQK